jgi:molybdate transport system substrate-binding protein
LAVIKCLAALLLATAAFTPRPQPPLTVFAAASLTDAFQELGDTLRRREPQLRVVFNFAGSQVLALQIEHGAAADVFASADDHWMAHLEKAQLLDGEPQPFAHNRLVLIVPNANPARIATLPDLARPGVKLILAAERVPAGRYARQAIASLGQHVLANVVSNEENVRNVVAKVRLGEADAGIVYASDVTPAVARRVRTIAIPESHNVVTTYPIAVLRHAPNAARARAFIALVRSPAGQEVLERHGFLTMP